MTVLLPYKNITRNTTWIINLFFHEKATFLLRTFVLFMDAEFDPLSALFLETSGRAIRSAKNRSTPPATDDLTSGALGNAD